MSTKQRLVLFLYNDHLRTEMVLDEVFSPSLCSSDQSWSKDSGWGEILKFFENILKHKTKKYFWTSPDVENTRRCDEEVGESWPGILWSGRNPRSGRLRPPPQYCSMALDHRCLLHIKRSQMWSLSKRCQLAQYSIFSDSLILQKCHVDDDVVCVLPITCNRIVWLICGTVFTLKKALFECQKKDILMILVTKVMGSKTPVISQTKPIL